MRGHVSLDNPAMRVAVTLPVAVLVCYAVLGARVARPAVAGGLLLVGVLLAVLTLAIVVRRSRPVSPAEQTAVGLLGVGLLPVLLVEGLITPAASFALMFVLVIVVVAFTVAGWARVLLLLWTLAAWFAALWWEGMRDPDLLLFHLGGGAIVVATVVRTSNALGEAVRSEARARVETEQRAELLARLLSMHTLEREEVLETVVDSLLDAGFDAASLRVVDGDDLVLAAGRVPSSLAMPERIALDVGLPGRAARSGRVERVENAQEALGARLGDAATAAVAIPFGSEDRLEGVITAVSFAQEVSRGQLETVEMLADLAGRAVQRVTLYEADEATVRELRDLEARTHDFVSTVSHELRTPLTVVQGLGQTLRQRWDDLAPDRRHDLLRRVDANADRLAQMVRSLLDTSAFEEGRFEIRPQRVDLASFLEHMLHRMASVTAGHPVTVAVVEAAEVAADPNLLEHVVENLLANAARHTPQGTRVEIVAAPTPDGIEVVVADEGPGIPAADVPHVLDRFYRGGEPSSRPPGGLGLGLALVRQILEAHGSQLYLESVEGEGTRFSFVLPVWTDDVPTPVGSD